jgi:hypothetical protein
MAFATLQLTLLLREHELLKRQLESSQAEELFEIDKAPDLGSSNDDNDSVQYDSKMEGGVLGSKNDDESTSKKSDENVHVNTCFNCDGEHQVRHCFELTTQRHGYSKMSRGSLGLTYLLSKTSISPKLLLKSYRAHSLSQ